MGDQLYARVGLRWQNINQGVGMSANATQDERKVQKSSTKQQNNETSENLCNATEDAGFSSSRLMVDKILT